MSFNYTVSCVIKNQKDECLADNGWHKDCNRAILFAPKQGEATIKALSEKGTFATVTAAYVIQNERFNYFAGTRGWVYDIADAKFYDTAEEAEKCARNMV